MPDPISGQPATPLWTAREAAEAIGADLLRGADWQANGVSIDTRSIMPGDLFVALKDIRDGHEFVGDAMARGAAASLVSRPDAGPGPAVLADDVLDALRRLGIAARDRSDAVRIAVTGSVGKTSVKEALAAVMRQMGRAHWSVKSYNNHWGVPLTLARMPRDTERAVFEMGMNHAGEIRELSTLVRPHVGLITRIGPAHLEQLGSIEAIADAKSEIFEGLIEDGVAIYPADDPHGERIASHAKKSCAAFLLDFGIENAAAIRVTEFETGIDGSRGEVDVMGVRTRFAMKASGDHWAWNVGAIFAACAASGLDARDVAGALGEIDAERGRGQAVRIDLPGGGAFTLLDDAYNANPLSMRAAIASLASAQPEAGGRRIAILGDMLELGPETERLHAELADVLAEAGIDAVYTCGTLMRSLHDALPAHLQAGYAQNAGEGIRQIGADVKPGDVVMVKGSNASGLHKIAASLADGSAFDFTEA